MTEDEAPGGYVRLLVSLERDPGGEGQDEEWLWAEPLGSGRFRLESTPFFAYGLSHGDLVRASDEGDMPRLSEVERKRPEIQKFLDELLAMGCIYEAMPPKIVALDVPPDVDVAAVVERLQARSGGGQLVWEWADPRPS